MWGWLMKLVWVVSATLVLLGACTSAPQPAPKTAVAEADKKICKEEKILGRMVPAQVCQTQAEWDELKERQAAGVKDANRATRSKSNTNGRITDQPF